MMSGKKPEVRSKGAEEKGEEWEEEEEQVGAEVGGEDRVEPAP